MNAKTNILLFLPLIILSIFTSCRSESDLLIEADEGQSLEANSKVANLMQRVAINDGSVDNIIDNSTCFTVKLPLTVIVNGSEEIINSEEDFQNIENIFSEFSDDNDLLEIVFPITLIFSDYTEQVVNNGSVLDSISSNCNSNDNIECVDFRYPFEISYFDSETEIAEILTMNNDRELFTFLENLKSDDVANIDFPITIVFTNNIEITINDTNELETNIEDSLEDCDQDDTTNDEFIKVITEGTWDIQKYKDDESNETRNYEDFEFTFREDGSVLIENTRTSDIIFGTWVIITRADGGLNTKLDFGDESPLNKLKNTWNVKKVQETRIMLDDRVNTERSKDELFFQLK